MKKKSLLCCILFSCVALVLTACGSVSKLKGTFEKEEYVVSYGETIDFYQNFSATGFEIEKMTLNFSNPDIFERQENGNYKIVGYGESQVFAYVGKEVVSTTLVFVKSPFSQPVDIKVSEDGVISWQKSFVVYDGVQIFASQYLITIDDEQYTTSENSYQLEEKGTYQVAVKALGDEKNRVDQSLASENVVLNYGVMQQPSDITISFEDVFASQKATISWQGEDANYKVLLDGIVIAENLQEKQIVVDLKNYKDGESASLEIVAMDKNGEKYQSSYKTSIQKLVSPQIEYSYDEKDGYLSFDKIEGAGKYLVSYSVNDGINQTLELYNDDFDGERVQTYLSNIESGKIYLQVQAIGSVGENTLFANSNASTALTFGKISQPQIEFQIEENTLKLTAQDDGYTQNYEIYIGDKSYSWDKTQNTEKEILLSDLAVGEYKVQVYALPKIQDGEVVAYQINEDSFSNVLRSNATEKTFYIVDQISEINSSVDGKKATLTINEIKNVDNYDLYINDEKVELVPTINDGVVSFVIEDLSLFKPEDNNYKFVIVAGRQDGMAVEVKKEKALSILQIVSKAEDQTNGYFAWNKLDLQEDLANYYYEIYKSDSSYANETELVTSNTTSGGSIVEQIVEEGYYIIKITTMSLDTNNYLNSNFYDENNVFKIGFCVTQQIETPQIKFVNDNGQLKLQVQAVDFATKYEIKVNGVLDGTLMMTKDKVEEHATGEYLFNEKFVSSGEYTISVVAKAGECDGVIYLDSQEKIISVEKAQEPTFEVEVVYDEQGNKAQENLIVTENDIADDVDITFNGEKVNQGFTLDTKNYNGQFSFSFVYRAKDSEGDKYYLDSNSITYSFKRVEKPTSILYNNGEISFQDTDAALVEKYLIVVTLVNEKNGNKSYITESESLTFDLTDYINSMLLDNEDFKSRYNQCSYLTVEVSAYAKGENEGTYLLPSDKGSTTLGDNILNIFKMESPKIKFDTETLTLSWDKVGQEDGTNSTYYDIYIDDELFQENYATNSIALSSIDDFVTEKKVYVVAKNNAYLDSANSNSIFIRKLTKIDNLNVAYSQQEGAWKVSFNINGNDSQFVEKVLVDDSTENVVYQKGDTVVSFALGLVSESFEIVLEAVKTNASYVDGEKYYISSDSTSFTIKDISSMELTPVIDNGKISWNDIAPDWKGVQSSTLTYVLSIFNGDVEIAKIQNITETKYILDSLNDDVVGGIASGEYQIQLQAVIQNYNLQNIDNTSVGYFGRKTSEKTNVAKLSNPQNITFTLQEDASIENLVERKSKESVIVSWNENEDWKNFVIKFQISVNGVNLPVLSAGDEGENFSLNLSDGQYNLILDSSYFQDANNVIEIVVMSDNAITADKSSITIYRLLAPEIVSVDDNGMLYLKSNVSDASKSFVFKIAFSATNQDGYQTRYQDIQSVAGEAQFDLSEEFLKGVVGAYTIQVVLYSVDGDFIANAAPAKIEGYRLSGITNISIAEDGQVIMTVASDAPQDETSVFTARLMSGEDVLIEKTFSPTRIEDTNDYAYTLLDFVNLVKYNAQINPDGIELLSGKLNFELTVKKEGNINAEYYPFDFNYKISNSTVSIKRAEDMASDYLVMDILSDQDTTTAFDVRITYTTYETVEEEGETKVVEKINILRQTYLANEIKGYWVVKDSQTRAVVPDADYSSNGKFSFEEGGAGYTSTACYAINLKDVLADVEFGEIKIDVSRVSYENEEYSQHNTVTKTVKKLLSPQEPTYESNYTARLKWQWSQMFDETTNEPLYPMASGYYVYFYKILNGQETFVEKVLCNSTFIDVENYLEDGVEYKIYIQAVSNEAGVVASNSTASRQVMKYKAPAPVIVENGKIKFEDSVVQNADFVQAIEDNYSSGDFMQIIASMTFENLFRFNAGNIQNVKMKLKLSNETSEYYAVVDAYQLLDMTNIFVQSGPSSNVNIITALNDKISAAGDSSSVWFTAVKSMNTAFANSNKGVSDYNVLFDIFGEHIPMGEYQISLIQQGNPNDGFIDSRPSSPSVACYINAAPAYYLDSQVYEGESKTHYRISFSTVSTKPSKDEALIPAAEYYMIWKNEKQQYLFRIDNFDGEWKLYNVGLNNRETLLEGAIVESAKSGYITIDVSNIIMIMGQEVVRDTYKVSIYASGNNYSINGKTEEMTLTLLGFDTTNIALSNGVFSWQAPSGGESTETRVVYKYSTLVEAEMNVPFNGKNATLELPYEGQYEYVVFSVLGNVSNVLKTMAVESESYVIYNVYKLHAPSITVENNNIVLGLTTQNDETDKTYKNDIHFKITNDVAKALGENYFYETQTISDKEKYIYQAGLLDFSDNAVKEYKQTELTANTFFTTAIGATSAFTSSICDDGRADYKLVMTNTSYEWMFLSSEEASINARMLESTGEAKVDSNGDLMWDNSSRKQNVEDGYAIFNKITVRYYVQAGTGALEESNYKGEKVFYSSSDKFDTNLLGVTEADSKFIVIIQKVAFQIGSKSDYDYQTIEGEYIKNASTKYQGEETFVLASEYAKNTQPFERQATVNNVEISNGKIKIYNSSFNNLGIDTYAQASGGTNKLLTGKYTTDGNVCAFVTTENGQFSGKNPYTISVYARSTYSQNTTVIKSNAFVVDNVYKLPTVKNSDFTLSLDTKNISSNFGQTIDQTYILDLSKYFASNYFSEDNNCYSVALKIRYTDPDTEETVDYSDSENLLSLTAKNSSLIIKIVENAGAIKTYLGQEGKTIVEIPEKFNFSIAFSVEDSQSADYYPKKKLINSDLSDYYQVESNSWGEEDSVTWNNATQRFEWTYSERGKILVDTPVAYNLENGVLNVVELGLSKEIVLNLTGQEIVKDKKTYCEFNYEQGEDSGIYYIEKSSLMIGNVEFLVDVYFVNTEGDVYKVEENVTSDLYYQPQYQGKISQFSVRIRQTGVVSLYSDSIDYTNTVNYQLFSGGSGTSEDPYQIKTAQEFMNIQYRNNAGEKVYFTQIDDIEITLKNNFLAQTFYGAYNGGGHNLTINFEGTTALNSEISISVVQTIKKFANGIALFENIDESASITNLKISYKNTYTSNSSVLVAPLAITNYGNISQVEVVKATYSVSSTVDAQSYGFGGIVAMNYGKISDCKNSASNDSGDFLRFNSSKNVDVLYGGIAVANVALGNDYAGNIVRCFNNGNKSISITRASSSIFIAGIVLSNNSLVTQSGNNAELIAKGNGNQFTSYSAGVVLSNNTGKVLYSFNNSNAITTESTTSQNNIGGVVYGSYIGSQVKYLVDAGGQKVVASATGATSSFCYGMQNVSHAVSVSALTEMQVSCDDNSYKLVVSASEQSSTGFVASIM